MSEGNSHTHVLSQVRLHASPRPSEVTETPLSILDAAAVPFPLANCVWFYKSTANGQNGAALSVSSLSYSLQRTVNAYPQWAGQLQLHPYISGGSAKERYGRLLLTYGSNLDPGVEFMVAESSLRLEDFLPSIQDRLSGQWDATGIPTDDFVSKTKFAMEDGSTYSGLPGIALQLTTLACGGLAVAIKMSHSLADAQSMIGFVRNWAAVNSALSKNQILPLIDNVFNPSLLERATAGDLSDTKPDAALVKSSRLLPVHRYDRWECNDSCPPAFRPSMEVTKPKSQERGYLSPAVPIPWSEWQFSEPSLYYHLYFSPSEINAVWENAAAATASRADISHLDALVAHLWKRLSQARNLDPTETVYLNTVLGIRTRLAEPLPPNYLGSPTMHIHTAIRGQEMASVSTGTLAKMIRDTIGKFNPNSLPGLLHAMNHEAGAQRLWQFFLGSRHTTCTSWLRQGVSTLEFVQGVLPRYVESGMPHTMDGIMKIMEAPRLNPDTNGVSGNGCAAIAEDSQTKTKKHWSDDGVLVSLVMNKQVMERLLKDPLLRGCGRHSILHSLKYQSY